MAYFMGDMGWTFTWGDNDQGIATFKTGATFNVSRSGWVSVRDAASQSDEDLKVLVTCLTEVLMHIPRQGDAIH